MALGPTMMQQPTGPVADMMMQGGAPPQAAPQGAGADIAHFIAQLAALPPKQAATILQMEVAKAQQQGDNKTVELLTQIGNKLNAGLATGEGEGADPVSAVLGAGFGG